MTLPLNSRLSALYDTNGTQKEFGFGFRVFFDPDNGGYGLEVRRQTSDGYEVIPKSDYLVLPVEDNSSGVVRFSVAPSAGQQIYIAGKTPTIQQLVLTNFGRYSAESIETQFDFITAIIQEWISALGEETRQRIAADDILTQYVVQRIDDFVQQVNQDWDDKSQEIEDYIATIMPSFTQIMHEEIEAYTVGGMQDAIDQTLAESKAEIDDAVARANAAATAAAITVKLYDTPEAGVDPVTGVADGAYFNVRSPNDESYIDEYQNVSGSAVATGKSYPSAVYVQNIAEFTPMPFVQGESYAIGRRVVLENGDIVKSTVANNTVDPNVDMAGWVNPELDQKIRNGQILNLATDFGAVGGTDCTDQIVEAIEAAIQTGLPLYAPTTTLPYLYRVGVISFTFSNLSANKSLTIFGDGEGSCFKCMDGQIAQRWGQSFRFAPSQDVDSIYIRDIKIDNNARGSAPPPLDDPYAFQQTATIATSPSLGVTIKNVTYENVVIVDPSADGFTDTGLGKIEDLRYINIIERDRTRVRASILIYHTAKKLVIINPIVSTIEAEPTNAPTVESATVQIINGHVKILDLSQKNETDKVNFYISGLVISNFCILEKITNLVIDGGVLRLGSSRSNFPYLQRAVFRNLTFKIPYDPDTGALIGLNFLRRLGEGQKSRIEFDNVDFEIDYAGDLPIPTTDYLVGNVAGTAIPAAVAPNHLLTIKNSRFDPRAATSVYAYRIGTVDLINNKYGGTNAAIVWGTAVANNPVSILKVVGGDFSAVTGASLGFLGVANSESSLTLSGDWFGLNASKYMLSQGTISNFDSAIKNTRCIVADALPTVALANDVFNVGAASATVGTVIEYQCTVSSTTDPTFICSKQLGMYEAATASLPSLTSKEKWAKAYDTTTNTIKTWTGSAWI